MNIIFVSHCDFKGNSAMHIYSIANTLCDLGVQSVVCIPNDPSTIKLHGTPKFTVVPFRQARTGGILFPDGAGPDLIHAWTPRELVRTLTQDLAARYKCPYLVHLEDNEDFIVESELGETPYYELVRLGRDGKVPEHRSHPIRSREFIAGAAGVTAVIDRLLEFKPKDLPGLVFWPGFDPEFIEPRPESASELRSRFGCPEGDAIIVYNGNIHEANADEVRSLFLAVRTLRRLGRRVTLLKTGWNYVAEHEWIREAVDSGAVRDLGFLPRSELHSLLSAANILVQPGRPGRFNDYRFPSKLPEFFASGKPVVLPRTNVGLSVRDGIDALLMSYGNAVEIAERVESLLDDPELASRLGQAGRKFALRQLTWSRNVPALRDFYDRVLSPQVCPVVPAPQTTIDFSSTAKLIAFYLPQFHPIPENNRFWGTGFTEWTNVTGAKPNFEGHSQPRLPSDLGFYDLRLSENLIRQAELARAYGVYGFCFYYYWFAGRRVLERPIQTMLQSGRPDLPFCVCWANENWTRNWDGAEQEILIHQDYSGDNCEHFIRDIIPLLKDPRYIRVSGAPMVLVYRVNLIPDPAGIARRWRQVCLEDGVGPIHLCAVQSFGIGDPRPYGFDAAVEFPPHVRRALIDAETVPGVHPDFEGYLEDYPTIVSNQLSSSRPDYVLYRGVMPAWDNTPRRGRKAHILVHTSPELYEHWLCETIRDTLAESGTGEPFVFINAWNEWAEGAYLEPDQELGHARLQATLRALQRGMEDTAAVCLKDPPPPLVTSEPTLAVDPHAAADQYSSLPVKGLSYATVRDYCDSVDHLGPLARRNGDLKDSQRPWVFKAILSRVHEQGRLLEIGAGEPIVADLLQRLGHEVWIVDPYDGSGNGPTGYDTYRKRYPNLKFIRSQFNGDLRNFAERSVDCIYSISVLEHVTPAAMGGVFTGLRRFLKPNGVTIHAIDHVHKGNGAEEHLIHLRRWVAGFGFQLGQLDRLFMSMIEDTDTYYLSAESHNRWRASVPYELFPMRVCVSIQVVAETKALLLAKTDSC
jgi:glycosyltransferase involved in cell wall biosynthesis/ubiquinone/menaquinone biosynthesis C-methylase UbiE